MMHRHLLLLCFSLKHVVSQQFRLELSKNSDEQTVQISSLTAFCLNPAIYQRTQFIWQGPKTNISARGLFIDSASVALAQFHHFLLFFCNTLSGKQQWVIDNSLSRMICGGNKAYYSNEHEQCTIESHIFLCFEEKKNQC